MSEWITVPGWTNTILNSEDKSFYVSYSPGLYACDTPDVGETALIWREPWKCLIINGDWSKEYEELVPKGYQACLDFYHSKSEFRSSWSED